MITPKKILVVDDDSTLRLGVQTMLRQNGYQTLEAEDGAEAKDLIYEHRPDLVILDMMMPRWGGFAVLEHFEKNPDAPPFLMLTGETNAKYQAYAKKVGVAEILHKPCSMKKLLQKIDFVFQSRGQTATTCEVAAPAPPMQRAARVLLVEVHEPLSRVLKRNLEGEGFQVDAIAAAEGDLQARATDFDVIVLDLMRPGFDGLALLADWRKRGIATDVLALTGLDAGEANVAALNGGADACLSRPFHLTELLARVRALVRRRVPAAPDAIIRVHDLEIDPTARSVRRAGQMINLTPREFSLLECLAKNPGQVMSRAMIWQHLYPGQAENATNVIDVYVRYLRVKLDSTFEKKLILTRWGEGYLLRAEIE